MHTNATFTLTRGVEQGRLDVKMAGVTAGRTVRVFTGTRDVALCLFYLVNDHTIGVDGGAKYEVIGLSFDLNISIRSYLTEADRGTDSEHGLPSVLTGQRMIELI